VIKLELNVVVHSFSVPNKNPLYSAATQIFVYNVMHDKNQNMEAVNNLRP
jgi:hypothetical protein